ncbi:MAG: PDZ domain-containing protein [Phycisphaerales bacterium]
MHPTSQNPTNQHPASRRSLPIALLALTLAAGTASAVWAPKDDQSPRPGACAEAGACPLAAATCDGTTADAVADAGAWRRKAGQPTQSDIWVAQPAQAQRGGQVRVQPQAGIQAQVQPRVQVAPQAGVRAQVQPGVPAQVQSGTPARQVMVITENNNGQECQVRVEGDQIIALRNGQPVPDRLVRRDNDRIIVSGDDGQEIMVVRISPDGRSFSTGQGAAAGATGGQNVIIQRQGQPGHMIRVNPAEGQSGVRVLRQEGNQPTQRQFRVRVGEGGGGTWVEAQPGNNQRVERQVIILGDHDDDDHEVVERAITIPHGVMRWQPQDQVQGQMQGRPGGPGNVVREFSFPGGHGTIELRFEGGLGGHGRATGNVLRWHEQDDDAGEGEHEQNVIIRRLNVPGGQGHFEFRGAPGATFQWRGEVEDGDDGERNVIIRRFDGSNAQRGFEFRGVPGATFQWQGQDDDDHGVQAHGQIVIDTGDGQPRVFEFNGLDDLHEHMGTLHEHLMHLEGIGDLHEHLQHLGSPEGMHRFLIELEDGHGLDLQSLNVRDLTLEGLDLEGLNIPHFRGQNLDLQGVLRELDLGDLDLNIRAEIMGDVEDAMRDLHIDLGDLGENIRLNVAPRVVTTDDVTLGWQPAAPAAPSAPRAARAPQAAATPAAPAAPAQPQRRSNVRVERAPEPPPAPSAPPAAAVSQPRAMIGIVMGDVPEDTAERLNLTEGSGFRIERVIEGLPAAEAGLEEGVVVVAIDGRSPATTMLLREIMGGKEPGDILTLQVVNAEGRRRPVEIELAPFRPDALEITTTTVGPSGEYSFMFDDEDAAEVHGDVSRDISAMIEALTRSDVGRLDQDELRERIQAIVRQHMAANNSTPRRVLVAPSGVPGQRQNVFIEPPAAPRPPAAPAAGNAALERRVNELAERLANLEQRLDRLTRALENRQRD